VISSLTFLLPSENVLLRGSQLAPHIQYAAQYLVAVTPKQVQEVFERKRAELYKYWLQQEKSRQSPAPKKST